VRWWWRILTCFLWEHALFLVCLAIYRLVPSSPQWVRTANARIRYQLAQAARVPSLPPPPAMAGGEAKKRA